MPPPTLLLLFTLPFLCPISQFSHFGNSGHLPTRDGRPATTFLRQSNFLLISLSKPPSIIEMGTFFLNFLKRLTKNHKKIWIVLENIKTIVIVIVSFPFQDEITIYFSEDLSTLTEIYCSNCFRDLDNEILSRA